MTFKDVIRKNFFGNVKQYLSFFLCSTFSIVIFFNYTTLIYNKQLIEGDNQDMFRYVMPVTVVGILLFSIFFLTYASSAFVKGRNKELGVYMSLGMTRKEIKTLINTQNAVINGTSLVVGLLIGTVLSRMFQLAILKILEIKNVSFHLDYKSFLTTAVTFFLICLFIHVKTTKRMNHMDITMYLKEDQAVDAKPYQRRDGILGVAGVVLMVVQVILLVLLTSNEELRKNMGFLAGYVLILFLAIYLIIAKGGRTLLEKCKGTSYYTRHMLELSVIHKKYDQNKRILFVLSILSTLTMIFVASPISLLKLSEEIAMMEPNSVEYVETVRENQICSSALSDILEKEKIKEKREIPFVYLSTIDKDQRLENAIPIVSLQDYNSKTGKNIALRQGECANLGVDWIPGNNGMDAGSTVTLYGESKSYTLQVAYAAHDDSFVSKTFPSASVFIVNDAEYKSIYEENKKTRSGIYHLISYEEWKKTKPIVEELSQYCTAKDLPVNSMIEQYEMLKKSYSTFLFVSIVLAMLFFISGGAVLYLRQMGELGKTKEMYQKLVGIGITTKERKQVTRKELQLIYFLPVIFGAFAGTCIIYYLTNLFGGSDILSQFMQTTGKVILAYLASQTVFYLITKRKYDEELNMFKK
ncbi:MAG: ABC transporter permease [bacterium]|nr:ABC transporter permease [bacterium]